MSFVVARDGNISLFRVGSIVAVLGVLLVAGGIAAYVLDQNSYKAPLEVAPFPAAESWGQTRQTGSTRRLVFRVANVPPEDVLTYYQQRLQEFAGGDSTGCTRVPAIGEFEESASDPTIAPYSFRCLFQRTGLRASQQTTVTIQPGVFNDDPEMNTLGMTVIEHSQRWQP